MENYVQRENSKLKPNGFNLLDTTLRDGEQQPGLSFSLDQKLRVCHFLEKLGIEEVELGIPSASKNDVHTIKQIVDHKFNFETVVWARATESDVVECAKTKADRLHVSLPLSNHHLDSMGKDFKWVCDKSKEISKIARGYFNKFSIGIQDASRASFEVLFTYMDFLNDLGVDSIRYADTVGLMTPMETYDLFQNISKKYPNMQVEFHGHNDFGLATANGLHALLGGAKNVNVTLCGIGERAGNTSLEELICLLELKFLDSSKYDKTQLTVLTKLMQSLTGEEIAHSKAIIGKNCFTHQTGIHQNLILKSAENYQPIQPETVGMGKEVFLFGKYTGINAVKSSLNKNHIYIKKEELVDFVKYFKEHCSQKQLCLTETELVDFYQQHRVMEENHNNSIKALG